MNTKKTRYLLHKNLFLNGKLHGIQEVPDVCKTRKEAVLAFMDAFRHLIGRKPSPRQVRKVSEGEILVSRWHGYEWNFSISRIEK